ncbi:MAG TPA: hypothetical protein VFO04_06040 [Nitrospira sp.]|nr:hypothetical protein [Nitrospira sp.]
MRRVWLMLCGWAVIGALVACSDEGEYFKKKVNEATMEHVAKRYGSPHKVDELDGNQTRWTYFKRSSGTVGYTGLARGEACQAYVLTFDKHNILHDWKQAPC